MYVDVAFLGESQDEKPTMTVMMGDYEGDSGDEDGFVGFCVSRSPTWCWRRLDRHVCKVTKPEREVCVRFIYAICIFIHKKIYGNILL
jgi:hypothetical protein